MQFKSLYPPICITSPSTNIIYIIAGGIWHQVDRLYNWLELKEMWTPIVYDQPYQKPIIVIEPIKYFVEGSKGNQYEVVNDNGTWTCSCPAHGFGRGKDCKHIKSLKNK